MTAHALEPNLLQKQLRSLRQDFPDYLDKDNALKFASQAIELHINCRRYSKSKVEKAELRRKINSLLDAAERIKSTDADLWNPKKHLPVELSSLHSSLSDSIHIKDSSGQPHWLHAVEVSRPFDSEKHCRFKNYVPISSRILQPVEREILWRGSNLYGTIYPPWEEPPSQSEFEPSINGSQFLDIPELRLSPKQNEIFAGWKRPSEALAILSNSLHLRAGFLGQSLTPTMRAPQSSDFVQDAASDCSVVASLCAGKARSERGHADVFLQALYPNTQFSSNGKYIVRFNFNGCFRKVIIDDRLPVSKSSRAMHVFDQNNPGLLWPALLEKAYLKIHGGYNFRGSNSGTDIWVMIGWVPEQVFLQSERTDANKIWDIIWDAFGHGDILITAGTGKLTKQAENDTGLVGEHDYAVLDLKELGGQRNLLIKNPWLNGEAWKGSCSDMSNENPGTSFTIQSPHISNTLGSRDLIQGQANSSHSYTPSVFWMSLNDLVQNFESLYLNWNPGLFSFREDLHFTWDMSPTSYSSRSPVGSFATNPQFTVSCRDKGVVWLLVWKHFADRDFNTFSPSSQGQDGFISLYAFAGDGRRVYLSRNAKAQTFYVGSPQTLLKLETQPGNRYTLVLSEQDLTSSEHAFTLSAFSTCPITLEPAPPRYSHSTTVKSSWTFGSAGGDTSAITYSQNPQFSLHVSTPTPIAVRLETFFPINVHVKLLHGYGQRMYSITARDILKDSGEHRPGCALAEHQATIGIGYYTIICSTFEPNQYADFTLTVDSSSSVLLKPIPREGAGRIKLQLRDASFPPGIRALSSPLILAQLAHFSLTARYQNAWKPELINGSLHSPIRLSVQHGRGPNRQILAQSHDGVFSDTSNGIRTDDLDIDPTLFEYEKVWLVLERLGSGFVNKPDELISVELWTDSPDAVHIGDWREWEG